MHNKRILWLDVLKGIGIITVIISHCFIPETFLNKYLYSFHMPLFFFASGYLFKKKKIGNFLIGRYKNLIIPYFLFSIISLCLFFLTANIGDVKIPQSEQLKKILGVFYGNGINDYMFNITIWFLLCLFIVEFIFQLIMEFTNSTISLIVILILFSIIGYLDSKFMTIRLPWSIDVAFTGIVFYGIGYLFKGKKYEITNYQKIPLILLLVSISLVSCYFNAKVDMNHNELGNFILFYLSALSGIAYISIISVDFRNSSFLSFLGRNSLIIVGTHTLLLIILGSFFKNYVCIDNTFLKVISLTSVVILFEYFIILFFNKYLYIFIGGKK